MGILKSLFSLDPLSMVTYRASQNLRDAIIALRAKHQFEVLVYSENVTYSRFLDEAIEFDNVKEITLEVDVSSSIKSLHIDFRGSWGGAAIMKKYGKEKEGVFYSSCSGLTYGSKMRTDEYMDMFISNADHLTRNQNEFYDF